MSDLLLLCTHWNYEWAVYVLILLTQNVLFSPNFIPINPQWLLFYWTWVRKSLFEIKTKVSAFSQLIQYYHKTNEHCKLESEKISKNVKKWKKKVSVWIHPDSNWGPRDIGFCLQPKDLLRLLIKWRNLDVILKSNNFS